MLITTGKRDMVAREVTGHLKGNGYGYNIMQLYAAVDLPGPPGRTGLGSPENRDSACKKPQNCTFFLVRHNTNLMHPDFTAMLN